MEYKFGGILFDNDGVLVDSEAIYVTVECELLAEIGLTYERTAYLSRFVGLSMSDYYRELAIDYANQIGGVFPTGFADELSQRSWSRMEAELKALPNVRDLVHKFNGPVAVASSMPLDLIHRKLALVGLHDTFESHIYSGEQVENGKPAPDLFLFTAQRLALKPEKCLVIEDSVNGVKAGVAAGMTVFGFVGGGHADTELGARLKKAGATDVFKDHSEISSVVAPKLNY